MAWIELHQSLPSHRKTLRLTALLRIKTPQAVGSLCMLWLWALDNARDGLLDGVGPRDLAAVCGFPERRAAELVDALCTAGFLDRDGEHLRIHDWDDYAGRLREMRERNKARKKRYREKQRNVPGDAPGDVDGTGTSADVTGLPDRTRPDLTGPDPTVPDKIENQSSSAGSGAGAPACEEEKSYVDRRFLLSFGKPDGTPMEESRRLAAELFRNFTARPCTESDVWKVQAHSTVADLSGEGIRLLPDRGRRDLLRYAFEAAAAAGRGGNWHYIEAVLERLAERGATTLRDAERLEAERFLEGGQDDR